MTGFSSRSLERKPRYLRERIDRALSHDETKAIRLAAAREARDAAAAGVDDLKRRIMSLEASPTARHEYNVLRAAEAVLRLAEQEAG